MRLAFRIHQNPEEIGSNASEGMDLERAWLENCIWSWRSLTMCFGEDCKSTLALCARKAFECWDISGLFCRSLEDKNVEVKPVSNPSPWPLQQFLPSGFCPCLCPCPDFLQWWTVMWKSKANKPFPPQVALVMVLITARVTLTETVGEGEPSCGISHNGGYCCEILNYVKMCNICLCYGILC